MALWLLAATVATVGVWAQFAPASFYASFAAGRARVAVYGAGDAAANVITLVLAVLVPCWLAISPTPRGDPASAGPRTPEVQVGGR